MYVHLCMEINLSNTTNKLISLYFLICKTLKILHPPSRTITGVCQFHHHYRHDVTSNRAALNSDFSSIQSNI